MSSTKSKVLITGSSNGLGWYLAQEFARRGHDILLHGRNLEKLQELKNKIGAQAEIYVCDLRDQNELKKLADFALQKNVKILVNNAGVICPGKELKDVDLQVINDMIDTNLKAPIFLTKLMMSGISDIININSMSGMESRKNRALYASSKWGLRGFAQSFKLEETGINVLDFYPTNMKTWPTRENAMEIDFVTAKIYQAFENKDKELILDGRKL
ncbi:MAG: SDR family NAD(P)-dependent oxidoreductase [Pseudomonadota bacterium]